MNTITIPKMLTKKGDLVIVPRKEYESLLELKKITEYKPTAIHKKALIRAERNLAQGKTLSYNELKQKLGFRN